MLLIFSCGGSYTNLCLEMFTDHWEYTPVDLYKNWKTIYDGFFTKIDLDIELLFEKVQYINKEFN